MILFASLPPLLFLCAQGAGSPDKPTILTESLPAGSVNVAYAQKLQATGGTEPYRWTIVDGKLPDGVALVEDTGQLSGIPKKAELFRFKVKVNASEPKEFVVTINPNLFGALTELGFTLRERAKVGEDLKGAGPAKFNYSKSPGDVKAYSFDGALLWAYGFDDNPGAFRISSIDASAEAHLSSNEKAERSVAFRAGTTAFWHFVERAKEPTMYLQLNALYESDQRFDRQGFGPEFKLTPTWEPIDCGYYDTFGGDILEVFWRPWFGAAAIVPTRVQSGTKDPVYRVFAQGRVELGSPWLATSLSLTKAVVFCELQGNKRTSKQHLEDTTHGFIQFGLLLGFNKNAGFEVGYKKGEIPPDLDHHVQQIYAGITLQF